MDTRKQEIISRIMKLLELGDEDKNTNPHERELAQKKAAKLMADYAIDFKDLREEKKDNVFVTFTTDEGFEGRIDWEATLAQAIAVVFDSQTVNTVFGSRQWKHWKLSFMGTKSDVEIAMFFFKYLRRTVGRLAESKVTLETIHVPYGKKKSSFLKQSRTAYCFGMMTMIGDRLKELYAKREEFFNSDCKALMVVKKNELADYVKQQFPGVRVTHARLNGDQRAFGWGEEDGKHVNLNRPIEHHNGGTAGLLQ